MPSMFLRPTGLLATFALLCGSVSRAADPVSVTGVPFEPRASLGGTFYRVTGDTCSGIVSITGGAATQLPSDRTLVSCLVYTRYTTAPQVAALIAKGMVGSGYLRTNEQLQATWAMLSYAGYTDRICQNLVFGVREINQQVNVGVYCLPYSWTKTKAENYASGQVTGAAPRSVAVPPPAREPLPIPTSGKSIIGTGTLLTTTRFCKTKVPNCARIKLVDASGEFEMQIMEATLKTGKVDVSYTYNPTRVMTAGFAMDLPLMAAKAADAAAFLSEAAGFSVPASSFQKCLPLKAYESVSLAMYGKIEVSCQNRMDSLYLMVSPH